VAGKPVSTRDRWVDHLSDRDDVFGNLRDELRDIKGPATKRFTDAEMAHRVGERIAENVPLPDTQPVLRLSARHPYDPLGGIDGMTVGRWDTSYDYFFMDPITATGPSVGEWEGSVLYCRFQPPSSGDYVGAVHYIGGYWSTITMHLSGPSGTGTASNPSNYFNEPSVVAAKWTIPGDPTEFDIWCTGLYGGWITAIEVFQIP
jgi:hypothetical protein